MDWLAYLILTIFYLATGVPIIGSVLTQTSGSLYSEDWKVGAIIHALLASFAVVLGAIVWAVNKVLY